MILMTILTNDLILEKMKQELPAGFKFLQLLNWRLDEKGQPDLDFKCKVDVRTFVEKHQEKLQTMGYRPGHLERFKRGMSQVIRLTQEGINIVAYTTYKKQTTAETEIFAEDYLVEALFRHYEDQVRYLELLKWMKQQAEQDIATFRAVIEAWMKEILTPSDTPNTNTSETGERSMKTMTNKPTFQLTDLESREKLEGWMDLHLESIDLDTLLEQLEEEGDFLENISPFYFEVGDEVIHVETYLTGEILEIHGERATVELPSGKIKQWELSELDMENRLVDLPAWGTIWKPSEEMECFIRENREEVRYEAGFHIYQDQQGQLYLGINGYGYNFLTFHFKPLFELFLEKIYN